VICLASLPYGLGIGPIRTNQIKLRIALPLPTIYSDPPFSLLLHLHVHSSLLSFPRNQLTFNSFKPSNHAFSSNNLSSKLLLKSPLTLAVLNKLPIPLFSPVLFLCFSHFHCSVLHAQMSSSSVCQGLQSCLEPCVMEPRVLSLKLALQQGSNFPQHSPPNTNTNSVSLSSLSASPEKLLTDHESDQSNTESQEGSGWNILRIPSQSSDCHNKIEDSVYVHPTVKRSSSILSEKSLEMCTESLGSENGSNAGDSTDDISLFSFGATTCFTRNTTTTTTHFTTTDVTTTVATCESKRVKRACNFPPPLTTITDLGGVQVRPRREGGRLILEAVASPSPCPYFRAEREDGRLRLCLLESFSDSEDEVCDVEEVAEEKEEENENEKNREEGGAEEECVENVEEEMGVTMFSRPSSCKESGKRDIFGDGLSSLSFPLFLSVSK